MSSQPIGYIAATADPAVAELPEIQPTCEWNFGRRGPKRCGKPASWAIVTCCHTLFVCTLCLSTVTKRWAVIELQCKTCRVVFNPASKTIRRVIPL